MRRAVAVGAVAVITAAGGCRSTRSAARPPASSGRPTTTTIATTAPPSTAASTAFGAEPRPSPEAVAGRLLDTWRAGDRASATRVTTSQAPIDALFARPPQPVQSRGCDEQQCVYRYGEALLRITVTRSGSGWLVSGADFEG